MTGDHGGQADDQAAGIELSRQGDPRSDEELRQTAQAQEAHGGSMAPGLVDATGHQVADPAGTEPPG